MSASPVGPRPVHGVRRKETGPSYPVNRLLPMALDAIESCAGSKPLDHAIRLAGQIRAQWLARGLPSGYWTYLARHGTAWLRVFLEDMPSSSRWDAMASIMLRLRRAGYPAPPSAEVLRYWLSINEVDGAGGTRGLHLLKAIPEEGLRMLFRAAGSLQSEEDADRFRSALPLVQQWLMTDTPRIDRNQERAGWPWLVSRSRAWLEDRRRSLTAAGLGGRVMTGPVSYYGYTAVPVATGVELLELGLALHNCLPSRLEYYLGPTKLMYRIEDGEGRTVAAVALDFDGRRWQRENVRGIANLAAPYQIRWLGLRLADCAQQAMEESGEETSDPDDEEESDSSPGCPYCDSEDSCDHLLLRVDTTFREALGGEVYDWFRKAWSETFRAHADDDAFDEGSAFDDLLERVEAEADSAQDDEFNGAPGQSSAYRVFYCSSQERVVSAIRALTRDACAENERGSA